MLLIIICFGISVPFLFLYLTVFSLNYCFRFRFHVLSVWLIAESTGKYGCVWEKYSFWSAMLFLYMIFDHWEYAFLVLFGFVLFLFLDYLLYEAETYFQSSVPIAASKFLHNFFSLMVLSCNLRHGHLFNSWCTRIVVTVPTYGQTNLWSIPTSARACQWHNMVPTMPERCWHASPHKTSNPCFGALVSYPSTCYCGFINLLADLNFVFFWNSLCVS